MPNLTDAEAIEAFSALRVILRERRLDWVVEQVEATISLGKPERRRLTKDDLSEPAWQLVTPDLSRRKGRASVFVVAEEYTSRERIVLLAEAVRAAIVQPLAFAEALFELLPPGEADASIAFQPELESGVGFTVDRSLLRDRRYDVSVLNRLLDELLQENTDAAPTRIAF